MSKPVRENIKNVAGGISGKISENKKQETANTDKTNINTVKKKNSGKVFKLDHKYANICLYVLLVVFFGTIIYMLINNWSGTKKFIYNLFEVLITVIGFIIIAFVFVIPQIGESISELASNIPVVYSHVLKMLKELQHKYPEINVNAVTDRLNEMVPDIVDYGTDIVGHVVPMIFSVSVSIVRGVINLLLALFISIYMINGKNLFRYQAKRVVYALFEEKKGDIICNTFRECNDIFSAFLISKAVDSLIIGCICCVLMNILRLPYTVLISVIVGITNMIPYFGPFIGAVPGVIIYLCTSPRQAIIFVIMILVLQQFDGLVLGPRLLGQSTGLNPMWVIFAITVGGAYFGVLGMFIGVPVVAVIGFLANKFIKYKLEGKNIKALKEWDKAK